MSLVIRPAAWKFSVPLFLVTLPLVLWIFVFIIKDFSPSMVLEYIITPLLLPLCFFLWIKRSFVKIKDGKITSLTTSVFRKKTINISDGVLLKSISGKPLENIQKNNWSQIVIHVHNKHQKSVPVILMHYSEKDIQKFFSALSAYPQI